MDIYVQISFFAEVVTVTKSATADVDLINCTLSSVDFSRS